MKSLKLYNPQKEKKKRKEKEQEKRNSGLGNRYLPVGIQLLREEVRRDRPLKLVKMPTTTVLWPSKNVLLMGL
jgi:hypothetical protein